MVFEPRRFTKGRASGRCTQWWGAYSRSTQFCSKAASSDFWSRMMMAICWLTVDPSLRVVEQESIAVCGDVTLGGLGVTLAGDASMGG